MTAEEKQYSQKNINYDKIKNIKGNQVMSMIEIPNEPPLKKNFKNNNHSIVFPGSLKKI